MPRAGHMTAPITVAATAADPTVGDEDLGAHSRDRHPGDVVRLITNQVGVTSDLQCPPCSPTS